MKKLLLVLLSITASYHCTFALCFSTYSFGNKINEKKYWKNTNERTSFISINDSSFANKTRIRNVIVVESILYLSTITGLYQLWYKNNPSSKFHFFNDNKEWLQMDKIGHGFTAYHISRYSYNMYRWCSLSKKHSAIYAGLNGFTYLTAIEILDGFSAAWGASAGDLFANTIGASSFIMQQLLLNHQPLTLKYSFHGTNYRKLRPDLLGENIYTSAIKDYNGQTYWISANLNSFHSQIKPRWLNVAIGYSADGLLGGRNNNTIYNGIYLSNFKRVRQYFFSLDIDFTKIKTSNKLVKSSLFALSCIKFPFPAFEFNSLGKMKFYPVYF